MQGKKLLESVTVVPVNCILSHYLTRTSLARPTLFVYLFVLQTTNVRYQSPGWRYLRTSKKEPWSTANLRRRWRSYWQQLSQRRKRRREDRQAQSCEPTNFSKPHFDTQRVGSPFLRLSCFFFFFSFHLYWVSPPKLGAWRCTYVHMVNHNREPLVPHLVIKYLILGSQQWLLVL